MKLDATFRPPWTVAEWCNLLPRLQEFARKPDFVRGRDIPDLKGWMCIGAVPPGRQEWRTVMGYLGFGNSRPGPTHLFVDVDPQTRQLGLVWLEAFNRLAKFVVTPWAPINLIEYEDDFRSFELKDIATCGWEIEQGVTEYNHNVLAIPQDRPVPSWLTHWLPSEPPQWNGFPLTRGQAVRYFVCAHEARLVNGRLHLIDYAYIKPPTSFSCLRPNSEWRQYPQQRCSVLLKRYVVQLTQLPVSS